MNSAGRSRTLVFPALFKSVDLAASDYQRRFFRAKATELGALILGALAGVLRADELWGLAGVLAVTCFVIAVGVRLSGTGQEAEKRWYDARAAAESVKSLAWEYSVAGEAFRLGDTDPDGAFVERLRHILKAVPHLDTPADTATDAGVTPSMQELRGADQDERKRRYHAERIDNQVEWYARKARRNKQLSRYWSSGIVIAELAAILVGVLRVRGTFDVDLLSVIGAMSAGMIAWIQAKNYTELSESYSVTSHEVGLVARSVRSGVSEGTWSQSVHDAEAAFSREHTMWLARAQSVRRP